MPAAESQSARKLGNDDRPTTARRIVIGYAVSAVIWACCWIPFSFGYYGFPWRSRSFRISIQAWAIMHLFLGGSLLTVSLRRRWRKTVLVVSAACLLSAFSCWAMYDWMARFLGA